MYLLLTRSEGMTNPWNLTADRFAYVNDKIAPVNISVLIVGVVGSGVHTLSDILEHKYDCTTISLGDEACGRLMGSHRTSLDGLFEEVHECDLIIYVLSCPMPSSIYLDMYEVVRKHFKYLGAPLLIVATHEDYVGKVPNGWWNDIPDISDSWYKSVGGMSGTFTCLPHVEYIYSEVISTSTSDLYKLVASHI